MDETHLDWLAKNYNLIMQIGKTWYVRKSYGGPWHKQKSLREAIDKGMSYAV